MKRWRLRRNTHPLLKAAVGTEVWVKYENHTPVGAFKLRGGLVYFRGFAQRTRGLDRATARSATHNVAEGAAAAPLAAALKERGRLAGKKAAVVLSGANVDRDVFARQLAKP